MNLNDVLTEVFRANDAGRKKPGSGTMKNNLLAITDSDALPQNWDDANTEKWDEDWDGKDDRKRKKRQRPSSDPRTKNRWNHSRRKNSALGLSQDKNHSNDDSVFWGRGGSS